MRFKVQDGLDFVDVRLNATLSDDIVQESFGVNPEDTLG